MNCKFLGHNRNVVKLYLSRLIFIAMLGWFCQPIVFTVAYRCAKLQTRLFIQRDLVFTLEEVVTNTPSMNG